MLGLVVAMPPSDFNYSFPVDVWFVGEVTVALLLASSSTLISRALMTNGIVIMEIPNRTGIEALYTRNAMAKLPALGGILFSNLKNLIILCV